MISAQDAVGGNESRPDNGGGDGDRALLFVLHSNGSSKSIIATGGVQTVPSTE